MELQKLLQEVLRAQRGLQDLQVDWVEELPCTKPGDNYTSVVNIVDIWGTLPGGDEFRDSVFVKRQPKSTVRRDLFNTEDCFTNEVTMYEHVLNDLTLPCARSFYATKELIILEDLRTSGYAMVERRSGLCVDDAARVLKALARFHGLSFNLLKSKDDRFTAAIRKLKTTGFPASANKDMLIASLKRSSRLLQEVPDAVQLLDSVLESFSEHVSALREVRGFGVLCHGDFWINNILIRDGNDPVRIVDFQNCVIASPGVDVWSFLYSSLEQSVMESSIPSLLDTYCRSFLEEISAGDAQQEAITTLQQLMDDILTREIYGFISGLVYLPALLLTEDQVPDLDTLTRDAFINDGSADHFEFPGLRERLCGLASIAKRRGLFGNY